MLKRQPVAQANLLGFGVSSIVTAAILLSWGQPGQLVPAELRATTFSVAVLQGPKQDAQEAPQGAEKLADAVSLETSKTPQVVAADRDSSLPEAIEASSQTGEVAPAGAQPEEVIPPAQVSMPGGRLQVNDAPQGEQADPFAIGPSQVFIRLWVDKSGTVVRGGIVRNGKDPFRDAFILKAMMTRRYATDKLLKIQGAEPLWQLDMVLDYGNSDFLP